MIGKNTNTGLKGIEKKLHLFTSRWPQEANIDLVKSYVIEMVEEYNVHVEEVPLQFGSMKAYKIILNNISNF